MRAFQYKILLRTIPTNKYLKMCNISDDDTCYFCKSGIETIEHLFLSCCPGVMVQTITENETIFKHKPSSYTHSVLLGCLDCSNQMCLNHIFNILKNIYVFHEMQ